MLWGRKAKIEAWTADAKKHWTVKDAELVNDGHGAYLATDKEYGDIELELEYRTVARADSGIYLRGRYEMQVLDDAGTEPEADGECDRTW